MSPAWEMPTIIGIIKAKIKSKMNLIILNLLLIYSRNKTSSHFLYHPM